MWGDRLLPPDLGYSLWESSHNGTHDALDGIPRDIVICDWHYEIMANHDYPSVRWWQKQGFRVWPAGCYHEEAVQDLVRVCRRDATPLLQGIMATYWSAPSSLLNRLTGRIAPAGDGNPDDRMAACVRLAGQLPIG